jgi:hypothetical protein
MAALTAARAHTPRLGDSAFIDLWKLPVKASTKIWAGSLVVIDAGYAAPATTALGKIVVGRAEQTVDNSSGSAGAKVIEVRRGTFKWNNSASGDLIAQADVGKICYAVDDQTVAKTDATGTRSPAGIIMQVESDGVLVESTGLPLAQFILDTIE